MSRSADLQFGLLTGGQRPIAVLRPVFLNDRKVQKAEVRGGRQRAAPHRLLSFAGGRRVHSLGSIPVIGAPDPRQRQRLVYKILLTHSPAELGR